MGKGAGGSEGASSFWRRLWEAFLTTWPLFSAGAVTFAFSLWVYVLASETVPTDGGLHISRWNLFLTGSPNTMGDTLAGFIGSLTLIWVVASVVQQSMELREQRKEFAHMVKAQEAQVDALNAQAEIFIQERRHREQDRFEELLDQKVERLRSDIQNYVPRSCIWTQKLLDAPEYEEPWIRLNLLTHDDNHQISKMKDSAFFRSAGQRQNDNYLDIASRHQYIVSKPKASSLSRVVDLLDSIVALTDNLSDAQKQRIENLRVVPLQKFFRTIQSGPLFDQDTKGGVE